MSTTTQHDLSPSSLLEEMIPDINRQRQRGLPLKRAFAQTAGELIVLETDTRTDELTPEGHAYTVMSLADDFEDGITTLNERGLSRKSAKECKAEKIIPFNHAVRRMIHAYPDLIFSDIRNAVVAAFVAQNRDELDRDKRGAIRRIKNLEKNVNMTLQGMRHEIGAQQEAEAAGYVVNSDVTVADELRGIDMWILMESDPGTGAVIWMPVDVKANKESADTCNAETNKDGVCYKNAVYSLLTDEDFYNSFRLDDERANKLAPKMKQQLEDRYRIYGGVRVDDFNSVK